MGQQMLGQIGSNIHPSSIVHVSRHINFAHGRVDQWDACASLFPRQDMWMIFILLPWKMIPFFRPVSRCDMWGMIHQVIAKFAPDQLFDKGLCICSALHHRLTGHMPHLTRTNFTQRQKLRQARGPINPHQIAPCGIAINARFHELK